MDRTDLLSDETSAAPPPPAAGAGPTDWQLMQQYTSRGSQDAFRLLVARHVDLVYATALRRVRRADLAEDVTQVVFFLLARRCGGMNEGVVLSAWLFRAAQFAASDVLKREGRRRRHENAAMEQTDRRELVDAVPTDALVEADLASEVGQAIGQLNDKDRAAVVLRYFEGRSLQQVGAALGTTTAAAAKRLERALVKLRASLGARRAALPLSALPALLAAHAPTAAPPGLAAAVAETALRHAHLAALTTSLPALVKGIALMTTQAKLKLGAAACAAVLFAAGATAVVVRHHNASRAAAAAHSAGPAPTAAEGDEGAADLTVREGPGGPRSMFTTIPAVSYDTAAGGEDGERQVNRLTAGSWLCYKGFDFGAGTDQFTACLSAPQPAGNVLDVRLDSPGGALLCSLPIRRAGGLGCQFTGVPGNITGLHDLYLCVSGPEGSPGSASGSGPGNGGRGCNLAWFKFSRPGRSATASIPALQYDVAAGPWEYDGCIGNLNQGHWVRYRGLNFGDGVSTFVAELSAPAQSEGKSIEVHLDDWGGPMIARLPVRPTGGWDAFAPETAPVVHTQQVTGTHDVFLRFDGGQEVARLASIRFTPGRAEILPPAARPATAPTAAQGPLPGVSFRPAPIIRPAPATRPAPVTRPATHPDS